MSGAPKVMPSTALGSVIATTWFGPEMSRLHALCVASWLDLGYEAHVYSYLPEVAGLPEGAQLKDARAVLPEDAVFFLRGSGSYANYSDVFRVKMLSLGLGIWCDADYLALRAFPATAELMLAEERGGWPCNAVMWMRPDHPILTGVLENYARGGLAEWSHAKHRLKDAALRLRGRRISIEDFPNAHWGRHALTHYVGKLGLQSQLLPQKAFFAAETYTGALFDPGAHEALLADPGVFGLHFFHKSRGDAPAEPGSVYAQALERHGARLAAAGAAA